MHPIPPDAVARMSMLAKTVEKDAEQANERSELAESESTNRVEASNDVPQEYQPGPLAPWLRQTAS